MLLSGEMCVYQRERLGQLRTKIAMSITSPDTLKARLAPIQEAEVVFLTSSIQVRSLHLSDLVSREVQAFPQERLSCMSHE